jgi:hypothetical protein
MSDPLRVQLSGPLLVFVAGFLEELLGRGYRPGTAASSRAIERHAQAIFHKLLLPDSEDDNRRVLAVLALLGH